MKSSCYERDLLALTLGFQLSASHSLSFFISLPEVSMELNNSHSIPLQLLFPPHSAAANTFSFTGILSQLTTGESLNNWATTLCQGWSVLHLSPVTRSSYQLSGEWSRSKTPFYCLLSQTSPGSNCSSLGFLGSRLWGGLQCSGWLLGRALGINICGWEGKQTGLGGGRNWSELQVDRLS